MTMTSAFFALNTETGDRRIIQNPTISEIQSANSVHVLGFTSQGELLIAESEGSFDLEDWDEIYEVAKKLCSVESQEPDLPDADETVNQTGMQTFLKSALQEKVAADLHWKD